MHETCDECGFDGGAFDDDALLAALDDLGGQWQRLLTSAGEHLASRPGPEVWSALEYAAHSRDVIALHVMGTKEALTGNEHLYPPFPEEPGGSPLAADDVDAATVAAGLGVEASRLAAVARDVGRDTWTRGITVGVQRSDVRMLLEHSLHDSTHHLHDVELGLEALRST